MDPCFYRRTCRAGDNPTDPRSDAIIILHVDDMRVAAEPQVLQVIHDQLYQEFQITTSDSGRFLGMDTEYDLGTGIFKIHMGWPHTLSLLLNGLLVLNCLMVYRTGSL